MSSPIRPLSGTEFPPPAAESHEEPPRPRLVPPEERVPTDHLLEDESQVVTERSPLEQAQRTVKRAVEVARTLPGRVSGVVREIRVRSGPIANDARRTARIKTLEARDRARVIINEKPLQVLGGVFLCGCVLGIALRIWRVGREQRW